VIASGGGGKPEDFVRVLTEGEADAALAASIFHYGTFTVDDLKEVLDKKGSLCVRRRGWRRSRGSANGSDSPDSSTDAAGPCSGPPRA
jgi:hypothetical protein